jgi:hypothetical protein
MVCLKIHPKYKIMKTYILIVFMAFAFTATHAQKKENNQVPDPKSKQKAPPVAAGAGQDQSICDSFNHIFVSAADTFATIRRILSEDDDDWGGGFSYSTYANIPGSSLNFIMKDPTYFYCHYVKTEDTTQAWQTYSNIIANLKVCLTKGPAKDVTNTYVRDKYKSRRLVYTYYVAALNAGYDSRLKNWMVQVTFDPTVSTVTGKTSYDLYIYIKPSDKH